VPELELELRELRIDWPETPDIAAAVEPRLTAAPVRPRRSWLARPAWQLAVAATALVIAVVMVIPPARAAVLDWLGFSSVRITREEPLPTLGHELVLGDPVTLERAREAFPVLVPEELGDPDAVYLYEHALFGPRVDLVYGEDDPEVLVTEFHAVTEPVIEKALGTGAEVERLTVDGDPAFFISGAPHGFAYVNPDTGEANFEEQRLAGNTLLVERADGVLVRLEADFSRERAVEIAQSLD
jgi:hypothetical protein